MYDGTEGGPVLARDPADEAHASAMGIWCQWALGLDRRGAEKHAKSHSWVSAVEAVRCVQKPVPYRPIQRRWESVFFTNVKRRVYKRLRDAGLRDPWDGLGP